MYFIRNRSFCNIFLIKLFYRDSRKIFAWGSEQNEGWPCPELCPNTVPSSQMGWKKTMFLVEPNATPVRTGALLVSTKGKWVFNRLPAAPVMYSYCLTTYFEIVIVSWEASMSFQLKFMRMITTLIHNKLMHHCYVEETKLKCWKSAWNQIYIFIAVGMTVMILEPGSR